MHIIMADIPVYLVAGFLDAGKTNFINGILEDGFARQDPTLLLCCEEGEEEYEKNALDNVTVITIEDEEDLKCSYLKELEKEYHPKQVLIEYNGMWQMERLYREVLPANWVLYQIMTFVYAPTFEMYAKNMGQLMMEKITNADMLVFNRCTPELRDALRKRNLRMVNRRADIYLEMEDGTSEDYLTGDECPFDLSQDLIDVPDVEYVASELLLLSEGRLLRKASPAELTHELAGQVWEAELAESELPAAQAAGTVCGIARVDAGHIRVRLLAEKQPPFACRPLAPELEDVYLHYFGAEDGL